METYCVSFKKNTANKNSSFKKSKQNWLMLLSNCAVVVFNNCFVLIIYKMISLKWIMSKIVKTFFLARDNFMAELHLLHPGFTCSTCGPFSKHRWRIQKFKQTGDLNYIHKNELDKACFARDAAYSDSKDLAKKIILDKILKDRAY